MQDSLFSQDVTRFNHHGNTESTDAHKSIKNDKVRMLAAVLVAIRNSGLRGMTCDEIEQRLEMSHQTASARCTEAKAKDLIVPNGKKRPTRSGRDAAVYILKEYIHG